MHTYVHVFAHVHGSGLDFTVKGMALAFVLGHRPYQGKLSIFTTMSFTNLWITINKRLQDILVKHNPSVTGGACLDGDNTKM